MPQKTFGTGLQTPSRLKGPGRSAHWWPGLRTRAELYRPADRQPVIVSRAGEVALL